MNKTVFGQIIDERSQSHNTRIKLFADLEKLVGRPVVSLFTSFKYPVILSDDDAEILEAVLQTLNLDKGLALLLSSPGGSGLAAERIINICRKYSGTGEYWVIVPGKAKSAATMVSFGASKILMGPASELGPIDPQLSISEDGREKRFSLCNVVASYKELFELATKEKGNLQPYLQQLARYDAREIKDFEDAISLSKDIAIRALKTGMMNSLTENKIEEKIKGFLTPEETKSHGRSIDREKAEECGLIIEKLKPSDKIWKTAYELYTRQNNFVSAQVAKCVESKAQSYVANFK